MTGAVDNFFAAAAAAVPGLAGPYKVKRIGIDAEICERLLQLILSGAKTGTFNLPWLHGHHPEMIPETDGLVVYIDFSDRPRAVVRQQKPEFVTYDAITDVHTACEGPAARDSNAWRAIHWPYWTRQLAPYGLKPLPDMPVCVERFTLLYPKSAA
jgi:uncharacterized protein YhfF